jgi:hypothetical protein
MITLFLFICFLFGCSASSEVVILDEEVTELEPAVEEVTALEPAVEEDTEQNWRGNSIGNLVGWGTAARQGNWIYYFVEQSDPETTGAFYKVRLDGSDNTLVAEIIPDDDRYFFVSSLNVIGDWIYYNDISVMKLNIETGELETLAHEWAEGLTVIGDWAYYISVNYDGAIVKIQTDGSNHTIVTDGSTQHFLVTEDYIYYEKGSSIYKIDHDGNNVTRVGNEQTRLFTILEEWIYYINFDDDKIYRVDLEGNQRLQISESEAYLLNAYKDWVFFLNNDDAKLYRVPSGGGEEIQISSFPTGGITIFDDWIFLYNVEAYDEGLYKMKIDGSELQKVYQ